MIIAQWGSSSVEMFEAGMLVCFGISWPVDIIKTLRTRRTAGKSLAFMTLVLIGYCSGLSAKFVEAWVNGAAPKTVTILYALNLVFVAVDIALYLRFRKLEPVISAGAH